MIPLTNIYACYSLIMLAFGYFLFGDSNEGVECCWGASVQNDIQILILNLTLF